jgi:hypothetical protein
LVKHYAIDLSAAQPVGHLPLEAHGMHRRYYSRLSYPLQ